MSLNTRNIIIKNSEKFDIQRRVVAHMTSESWKTIPHVGMIYEPDITPLFNEFQNVKNESKSEVRITLNTLMLKIISEGLKAAPELNALIEYNPKNKVGTVHQCESINIAMPWLLPDGRMITPVVRDVGNKNLPELALAIKDLERRIANTNVNEMLYEAAVRETLHDLKQFKFKVLRGVISGKIGSNKLKRVSRKDRKVYSKISPADRLTSEDITCGTMLVSNIGSAYPQMRGSVSLLEIIPPQVFVIGLNSMQERPTVVKNSAGVSEILPRKILPLCLTFDHRALDFGQMVPFLRKLDEIFANPQIIKSWL